MDILPPKRDGTIYIVVAGIADMGKQIIGFANIVNWIKPYRRSSLTKQRPTRKGRQKRKIVVDV